MAGGGNGADGGEDGSGNDERGGGKDGRGSEAGGTAGGRNDLPGHPRVSCGSGRRRSDVG